jgi:hypothetical protein
MHDFGLQNPSHTHPSHALLLVQYKKQTPWP